MADGIEVGTAIWRAALDRSKLQTDLTASTADIKRAADASERQATTSATSTMQKIQGLSRTALTTVSAGAGALFAVGTKLAVEGTDAMAKFQAQTGATADEAKTAFESMNRLAGENLQSFGTISDALTQVTTNMGVTGQAAEDTTNAILKFSTATGTDAVQNVAAFDDVLDAWGKTAADLPGIMDIIVASTQKFGGSVGEAQQALKDMAPALQGMGASLEDGVGLLDLFRASGADASAATSGLNKALKNLKPGQSLDDLIAQIGAIEDPAKRAQEAIRIFGRSGATLGNVIKPGMTSLDDFKVSMDDAANATTDAASAIEDTLPNKVKLAVSGALAQARSFATDLGPALMGVSSLASVGTSIASALKLDDALKGAWTKAAENQAVKSAASAAGGALGKLFVLGATVGLAAVLVAAMLDEWKKAQAEIDANPDVAETGVQGRRPAWFGQRAEIIKEAAAIGTDAVQAVTDAWYAAIEANGGVVAGSTALFDAQAALDAYKAGHDVGQAAVTGADDGMSDYHHRNDYLTGVTGMTDAERNAAAEKAGRDAAGQTGSGFDDGMAAYHHRNDWLANFGGRGGPGDVAFHVAGVDASKDWTQGFSSGWGEMAAAGKAGGYKAAGSVATGFGLGLRAAKGDAEAAWADYLDALNHPMRGANLLAFTLGKLHGAKLAAGLRSSEPGVHDAAVSERDSLINTLEELKGQGYTIGQAVPRMLAQGMTRNQIRAVLSAEGLSKAAIDALLDGADGARGAGGKHADRFASGVGGGKGKAKTAAGTVVDSAKSGFDNTAGVYQYGVDLVDRYAAGMARAGINAATIAEGVVVKVGAKFADDVPIPPSAPEHIRRVSEYGQHFIQRWVAGMWSQGDVAARSAEMLGSHIAGSLSGSLGPMQRLTGGGASIRHEHSGTVQVRLSGDTIAAARAQGASWDDVGRIARSANGLASGLQMRLSVNG